MVLRFVNQHHLSYRMFHSAMFSQSAGSPLKICVIFSVNVMRCFLSKMIMFRTHFSFKARLLYVSIKYDKFLCVNVNANLK